MRAALLPAFGSAFELLDMPNPRPDAGEVVVDVVACGAGLTLELVRSGGMGGAAPLIMGHEFAGRVSEIGERVDGWTIGDPVTASFYLTCGTCDMCASGHESLCRNFKGWIGAAINGAFAEKIAVPARNLVRLPADLDLPTAGIIADAVATPYHVARDRLGLAAGQRVVVLGAGGGLGVHMCLVVRAFGGVAVAVEKDAEKLLALRASGHADVVIDAASPNWEAALLEAAGDPAAVVDTVGSSESLGSGMQLLGTRSKLVILGLSKGAEVQIDPARLLMTEAAVLGTRYCNRAEIQASVELVSQGKVPLIVGARFPLEAINEAFEAMRANAVFGRILIDVKP